MSFSDQLRACEAHLAAECYALPAPYPAHALFFSVSDGSARAHVVHASGPDVQTAWSAGVKRLTEWMAGQRLVAPWLRVDWVEGARAVMWNRLLEQLELTKRNYFRYGIALDERFEIALTEQELNANAMLYGGAHIEHAVVNLKNFKLYARSRFGAEAAIDLPPSGPAYLLAMRGVFCHTDGIAHPLCGSGLNAGRREPEAVTAALALELACSGAAFLARQVGPGGRFVHGHFPCFDRPIPTYNAERHAVALQAMIEAWVCRPDDPLRDAIERAAEHLALELVRHYRLPDGHELAFLVDGDEIRLGGSAACLLALVQYSDALGSTRWLTLLERLAEGVLWLQDPATGRFDCVLHAPDLSPKPAVSASHDDGLAAFALMRLHGFTRDARWLAAVEKAFEYFIDHEQWRAHDHWIGRCVNDLVALRPDERYVRFGLLNAADHLDFALDRKTTFPTLLELLLAAQALVERTRAMPSMTPLLALIDTDKLNRAVAHRAHYQLNGVVWPEMAMYFKHPAAVLGAFFIRHQSFRVRIDDVAHYLSGFLAYHRLFDEADVESTSDAMAQASAPPDDLPAVGLIALPVRVDQHVSM